MMLQVALVKRHGRFTLDAAFSSGEKRLGIFGCSGSGKSTLAHLLAGTLTPDEGSLILNGETLYCSQKGVNLPPEKRRIGLVFQNGQLFSHLNVEKNLLYGYRRLPRRQRRIDPDALIRCLELSPLLSRRVTTLSGGERQRVALGRSVLANPRLLVLDEPLSALDDGLRYRIIPYLTRIIEAFEIPMILISHSMNEMRLMADEIVVLHQGAVSEQTTPDALAKKRMKRSRAGFINLLELNRFAPKNGLMACRWGEQPLLISAGDYCRGGLFELSSKDIMLFKQNPEAISARNLLPCRVESIFPINGRVGIDLICAGGKLTAQIARVAVDELGISEGGLLYAAIKASAFRRLTGGSDPGLAA